MRKTWIWGLLADVSTAEGGAAFVDATADALGAAPDILVANGGGPPSADNVPVGVIGRRDDFGAVAAFLCGDHTRFIAGASIPVDGGAYPGLF